MHGLLGGPIRELTPHGAAACVQVSRGHALQAEILQLSSSLPAPLQGGAATKFTPMLFDFRYFKAPDAHEAKLEASRLLIALDEEFREVRGQCTISCHGCIHPLFVWSCGHMPPPAYEDA